MTYGFRLLPLLFLAGCQTGATPYAPVENVRYSAIGNDPFWMVTIGDDAIVLTVARSGETSAAAMISHRYPRTLPRTVDGVRSWQSEDGTAVIHVEAWAGPCTGSGGIVHEDVVRVRLSGRELRGCGGRILESNG
jgi:uncharacterized membrane protein